MNLEKKAKKSKKRTREHQVLLGLVELYLQSGKPIGSNTLKENGFEALSSATIRNYFSELEKEGYLRQPHSSGGRIPTNEAFRLYAEENFYYDSLNPEIEEKLHEIGLVESKDLTRYLQTAADRLSEVTGLATFLSSVRFDHDLVVDIKFTQIDHERILAILITEFGQILTEVLWTKQKLSSFALKRIEAFIQWRIKGGEKPEHLEAEEQTLAQRLYQELMVRYLVRYSNFSGEDIYRTGFSRLLNFPEFSDPVSLTTGLSLFENLGHMRLLLTDCARMGELSYWIGSDLAPYASAASGCSVVAIPYYIGNTTAGAIGILGPCRIPYKTVFASLRFFSECISKSLTKSLVKFKLSFRQPRSGSSYMQLEGRKKADQKLLEIKEP